MLNNNKNLNGSASSGSTNNNLELDRIREAEEEAAQVLPTAHPHSSIEDEWGREQKNNIEENKNRIKSTRRCFNIWNTLLMLGLCFLGIYAVHISGRIDKINSSSKDTDDSVSVTDNGGPSGNDVIRGEKGDKGDNGIDGVSPELSLENQIIYSNGKELVNLKSLLRNFTLENKNIIMPNDYQKLDHAPGSTYVGRSFDPVRDTHGPSILVESYDKGNIFTNPITGILYKRPDFIANFDQNHESSAVSSTELFESTTEYKKSKASEFGISGGYGGMFEASASSGQRSAMVSLSQEDTAVAQSMLYQKTYEAKAEQNLLPFVKDDFINAASSLPEFPDRRIRNSGYNLRGSVGNLTKEEQEVIDKYNDFSTIWGDFIVTSIDLGGSITMLSEISHISDLIGKYSRSVVKASVGGGWGPFSAKADVTNTVAKSSAEQDVKSNSKDTVFVTSGSGVGDMDDPSSVVSNLDDWGDEQMQAHMDRSRRSPVVISEKVTPIYHYMPESVKYYYKKYMEYKYGTETQSLADITAKFNAETAKTKDALNAMKEELHGKILDIHIPDKSSIRFSSCYWEHDHKITTCTNSDEVVKSLKLYRRTGNSDFSHYWTNDVQCCTISAVIS
tara:strand:- start:4409 stop:6259 length:1851 start_codon:yes stop_codon:yes gene_type:complete